MRLPLALAALLLPLAGCAGDPDAAAEDPDALASPAPAASATATAPDAPAAPAFDEVDLPFEREGRTWTTACVIVQPVAGRCQHVAEGSAITEWLPEGEPLAALAGTITWSEGNAELGIGLVVEAADGSLALASPDHYASGPSPLAFAFDLRGVEPDGGRVGFHVASYTGAGTPEAHVDVSPGQDWALDGTLTVLRPT